MGSQCDIDKKNVIMVNIEELSEEDQRKYTELQEYIKQQFLSGAKKDRSGKVTLNQDFELPAIKLNKDKDEVIPTESQASSPDLVTQLSAITDRFELVFNDQSSLVASVVTGPEKIEGKRVINISNDGIPQVDSQGVLHSTTSVAQEASPEVHLYGMPIGFYRSNFHCLSLPRLDRPQAGLTARSGPMVMASDQSLPLSIVPSTLVQSQNNVYGTVSPMYSTIAHTSPPIRNVATSYGVPNDVFTDLHHIQNPNQPPVGNLRTAAMQSRLAARNELAQFKEEIANMMKNKLGVDMGNTRLYKNPYRTNFDYVVFPLGWRMPDFVKFSGDDNRTTWEHISQYTVQLGEAGTFNSLKVRLFSLSLTGTAFAWFSSLTPNSIDSWDQLEKKFHDHFFSRSYQLKLIEYLTSVRQNKEESISD
jgi:hypothetical protein